MNHAERDYYDWLAHKLPTKLVLRDGTVTSEAPELSWEMRARLAEEKLASLVEGLESEDAFTRMLMWNPLANAIATMTLRLSRQEHDG